MSNQQDTDRLLIGNKPKNWCPKQNFYCTIYMLLNIEISLHMLNHFWNEMRPPFLMTSFLESFKGRSILNHFLELCKPLFGDVCMDNGFQLMTLTGPCWFSSIIWYCISSKRKWCSAGRTSWIVSPTRRKWIRRTGWWSSVKTILTCNDYLLLVLIEYFCKIQVLIVICKQCFFQLI